MRRRRATPARSAASPPCRRSPNQSIAQIGALDLALHDAQSVIAREHGFPSWTALRDEVEARTLSFDAAVDEFLRCATGGASGRANRLLALYPNVASATLQSALVLCDAESVEARLRDHPELATQPGGPQNWEPLLYVCHTCLHLGQPARLEGLVAIARRLCALGANPNAEYHWNWHPELPRTALWGAICAVRHLPLADGAARGRRQSDRRRVGAHRRRRRRYRSARTAESLRRQRGRDPGRRAAARLHDDVGRERRRPVLAARARGGPQPRVGRGRRGAAARRCPAMGCLDGRAAGAARRRCIEAPHRRQHPTHAGRVTRQRGDCGVAARARRERTSSPFWIASLPPARAPTAPAHRPCWRPAPPFERSCARSTS